MDVSVILVNYNTKDLTRDCLKSIYEYTKNIDFEVYVVDNNSQDGSIEMIEQEFPQVILIKNEKNVGFGAANNIAIRQSNAKYVFCLNTDTLLLDNAIKKFYDFMEKDENKKVGVCGGGLLDKDMKPNSSYHSFPRIIDKFSIKSIASILFNKPLSEITYEKDKDSFKVDSIIGADLFMRKSVILETGLFDEDFFMYCEETELQYRMHKKGYISLILPQVNIIHYWGFDTRILNNAPIEKLMLLHKSELLYYKKTRNSKYIYPCILKLIWLVRYILKIQFNKNYFRLIFLHLFL